MKQVLGDYDSGQITLTTSEGYTHVSLRWPFDRETDEWINISASFLTEPLRDSSRISPTVSLLHEQEGATISLKPMDDGRFRFFLRGKNSTGPVEADLILSHQMGTGLQQAFAHE